MRDRAGQLPLFAQASPARAPLRRLPPPPAATPAAAPRRRLWLCLRLPALAVEVLLRREGATDTPLAVIDGPGGRQRIHAVCPRAEQAGIAPGMRTAEALARLPALRLRSRDPEAERRCLDGIARLCGRWASWISVRRPDTLFLEIAPSLRLFGGLPALHREVCDTLSARGHRLHSAVAPTPRAALWLATHRDGTRIASPERLVSALADLPLSVLELDARGQRRLAGMGLRRLGDLMRLPRDGLLRRFGPDLLHALDRACGRREEPLPCLAPAERFEASVDLPLPSADALLLARAAGDGLERLQHFLRARDLAVDRVDCLLLHHRLPPTRLRIGTSHPTRDAGRLLALLEAQLARTRLPAPVECLRLRARRFLPHAPVTADALDRRPAACAWQDLLDTLRARCGVAAVWQPSAWDDHRPERAARGPGPAADAPPRQPRPLWLLATPEPLACRGGRPWHDGPLRLLAGPERIEQGWWDGCDVSRDYYVAADARHNRLWIFQDRRVPGWHLHGWFA